jgi:hypothetical protein
MRISILLATFFILTTGVQFAHSHDQEVDLSSIERSIAKEPSYVSTPKYCLLVFGHKAEKRAWIVKDGHQLFVDVNQNGDLTDPGERFLHAKSSYSIFYNLPQIAGHTSLKISLLPFDEFRVSVTTPGSDRQVVGYSKADKPAFNSDIKKAPIIHLGGPMSLGQYSTPLVLTSRNATSVRGSGFRVMLGTPGVGKGTFAAYHCKLRRKMGSLRAKITLPEKKGSLISREISQALKSSG